MLPTVGTWELIIILLVAFLVFGPKRLPEIGSSLGKGIRAFKREMQGISDEIHRADDASSGRSANVRRSPEPAETARHASPEVQQGAEKRGGASGEPKDDGPVML